MKTRNDPIPSNRLFRCLCLLGLLALACSAPLGSTRAAAPPPSPAATADQLAWLQVDAYPIGQPTLTELYLSPTGSDANDGLASSRPLRSLHAAWSKIPASTAPGGTGYRLNFLPGVYPCEPGEPDNCLNSYGDRRGSYEFPIILQAAGGAGTVTLRGGLDIARVSYLYLIDLTLSGGTPLPVNHSGNNLLHLAEVDHVLLRRSTLNGPDCANDGCNTLQEVLKVNQAEYIYVEDSLIHGAHHSVVDYVSVQWGHFTGNRLHTAGEWCMYVKGGSAYHRIERNEFHGCHLGFQAGQSSNLAVMRSPWLHYEVYDLKFINNVMHDLPGVPFSVSGGYNVLLAYNTLYRVGYAEEPGYALLQTILGERGCNPTDEIPDPVSVCLGYTAQGGWGPAYSTLNLPVIPNQNLYFVNNLIYNPAPAQTRWAHLNIAGPGDLPAGFNNLPAHPATDNTLVIAGNLIWNGPPDHPLGLDESTGCAGGHPTCSPAQLLAQNTINSIEPQLVDAAGGDYRPLPGGSVFGAATYPLSNFTWGPFTPAVPAGNVSNVVTGDYTGAPRPAGSPPGAYAGSTVPMQPVAYLPLVMRSAGRASIAGDGVPGMLRETQPMP